MSKPAWRDYPKTDTYRTGCKVGWRTYDNEADAKLCSEAAKHNAVIQENLGFDFGYCSPGSIDKTKEGKYEVCIP